jgi:hypothetical protein
MPNLDQQQGQGFACLSRSEWVRILLSCYSVPQQGCLNDRGECGCVQAGALLPAAQPQPLGPPAPARAIRSFGDRGARAASRTAEPIRPLGLCGSVVTGARVSPPPPYGGPGAKAGRPGNAHEGNHPRRLGRRLSAVCPRRSEGPPGVVDAGPAPSGGRTGHGGGGLFSATTPLTGTSPPSGAS